MKRLIIDTNLIIRYILQDNERQSKIANRIFAECDEGKLDLIILPEVLAECVFVLESFYKRLRTDIAATLIHLIECPNIGISEPKIHSDALLRYASTKLHFVDCVLAATAATHKLSLASFDAGFKAMRDVKIETE
jgi:predicted nucleic-acid-binding protein